MVGGPVEVVCSQRQSISRSASVFSRYSVAPLSAVGVDYVIGDKERPLAVTEVVVVGLTERTTVRVVFSSPSLPLPSTPIATTTASAALAPLLDCLDDPPQQHILIGSKATLVEPKWKPCSNISSAISSATIIRREIVRWRIKHGPAAAKQDGVGSGLPATPPHLAVLALIRADQPIAVFRISSSSNRSSSSRESRVAENSSSGSKSEISPNQANKSREMLADPPLVEQSAPLVTRTQTSRPMTSLVNSRSSHESHAEGGEMFTERNRRKCYRLIVH